MDGLCGEAEAGKHPPPLYGGGVCKDGSEVRFSLASSKAFCTRDGSVKETKLELVFSRYKTYEEKIREVYRPKGLLAFAATAREHVRIL